jgi:transposase
VFTGAGRRRTWRDEDKARIVAEIATSEDSVCAVARRHGLSPQQLFGWRRQLRESETGRSEADGLQFVLAVVDAGSSPVLQRRAPHGKAEASAGTIEVEIETKSVGGRVRSSAMVVLRLIDNSKQQIIVAHYASSANKESEPNRPDLGPKIV